MQRRLWHYGGMLTALTDVLLPVILVAGLGALLASRFTIDQHTVSRITLYLLSPALVLDVVPKTQSRQTRGAFPWEARWPQESEIFFTEYLRIYCTSLLHITDTGRMWRNKVLLCLSLSALSCAETSSEQTVTVSAASTSPADVPAAESDMTASGATGMNGAGHEHSAGGTDLTSLEGAAFDRAFLSMMVAHHQGAVEMSQSALASTDPQVRGWAEAIVTAQESEIEQMTAMLEPLGGLDEAAASPMRTEMAEMTAHTTHASDPDRAFVQAMLPHHQSALEMAQLAEGRSENAEVLALAHDIVATQQREMTEFEEYLAQ